MLVLTFQVDQVVYAVPVSQIIEVIPRVELRPVPHAPRSLLGLLRYRGSAIPVIDLSLLMGRPACVDRLDTRILLVRTTLGENGDDRLGLLAEQVNKLVNLDPTQTAMRPPRMLNAPYLGQVYETAMGLLQLIDPGQITVGAGSAVQGEITQ